MLANSFVTEELSIEDATESFYAVLGHMAAARWEVREMEVRNGFRSALLVKERWSRRLTLYTCTEKHADTDAPPEAHRP